MIMALVYLMLVLLLLPVINICGEELKRGCKIEKPGVFLASGDVVLGSPVGGAADTVVGILEIRLTVPHKIN
jgi:hypothetical protein